MTKIIISLSDFVPYIFFIGEAGCGKVVQRFPEADWPDVPFTPGIELVSAAILYSNA